MLTYGHAVRATLSAAGRTVWVWTLALRLRCRRRLRIGPRRGRFDCFAVFPRQPSLSERGIKDGVGEIYQRMFDRSELLTIGEHVSDVGGLFHEVLERWGRPGVIVADRWREGDLREVLQAVGFPFTALSLRGQGFKDGSEDVRAFQRAVLDGKVTPVESLLLRSALSEARIVVDPAGNQKLSKNTQGGRRLRARDDAAAAAILAVAEGTRRGNQPDQSERRLIVI